MHVSTHDPSNRSKPQRSNTLLSSHSKRSTSKSNERREAGPWHLAAVQPATIKGFGGSSLSGTKLHVNSTSQSLKPKSFSGAILAKYGDKGVYFDLEDLGNTTGQWDLYGSDAPSPYIQPSSVRALNRATAPDDVLPIKKGPPTSTKTRSS